MKYPKKLYLDLNSLTPKSRKKMKKCFFKQMTVSRVQYDFRAGIDYTVTSFYDYGDSVKIELTRTDLLAAAKKA
jgi:hypothetical protein